MTMDGTNNYTLQQIRDLHSARFALAKEEYEDAMRHCDALERMLAFPMPQPRAGKKSSRKSSPNQIGNDHIKPVVNQVIHDHLQQEIDKVIRRRNKLPNSHHPDYQILCSLLYRLKRKVAALQASKEAEGLSPAVQEAEKAL